MIHRAGLALSAADLFGQRLLKAGEGPANRDRVGRVRRRERPDSRGKTARLFLGITPRGFEIDSPPLGQAITRLHDLYESGRAPG